MFQSKFDQEKKRAIVQEREIDGLTIKAICIKYGITPATFYSWKNKTQNTKSVNTTDEVGTNNELEVENEKLKMLYINLSAHNYELAKFLNK
jgi:transposase-like protein